MRKSLLLTLVLFLGISNSFSQKIPVKILISLYKKYDYEKVNDYLYSIGFEKRKSVQLNGENRNMYEYYPGVYEEYGADMFFTFQDIKSKKVSFNYTAITKDNFYQVAISDIKKLGFKYLQQYDDDEDLLDIYENPNENFVIGIKSEKLPGPIFENKLIIKILYK